MFSFGEWMTLIFIVLGAVAVFGLFDLNGKVDTIMAVLNDLTTLLTNVSADVDVIAAHERTEPGSVVTQAQLDAAVAQAQALKDKTAAVIASFPPTV